MTTENFCFYLQNRLIQTSQTGGQLYSDTSPFSIPCCGRSQSHSSSRRDIVTKPKLLLQMYFSPSFVSDAKSPKSSVNFFRAKCRFAYSSSCSVTWPYTSMLSWNNYAENIFVSFDITSLENSINVQLTIFKNFVLTIFCSAVI